MKPTYIIIHHSASPQGQTAQAIDNYHKGKWNFRSSLGKYAGYQYIIAKDGTVTQHRKDDEPGAHCREKNMNYKSIGICVVGWYDDGHHTLPTKRQQTSLGKLLVEKMAEWGISRDNVQFHRDYAPKTCPGLHITQDFISGLLNENVINNEEPMMHKKIDGDLYSEFGDNIQKINFICHREHEDDEEYNKKRGTKRFWINFIDTFNDGETLDAVKKIIKDRPWDEAVEREKQRRLLVEEKKKWVKKYDTDVRRYIEENSKLEAEKNDWRERASVFSNKLNRLGTSQGLEKELEDQLSNAKKDLKNEKVSTKKLIALHKKAIDSCKKETVKNYTATQLFRMALKKFLG